MNEIIVEEHTNCLSNDIDYDAVFSDETSFLNGENGKSTCICYFGNGNARCFLVSSLVNKILLCMYGCCSICNHTTSLFCICIIQEPVCVVFEGKDDFSKTFTCKDNGVLMRKLAWTIKWRRRWYLLFTRCECSNRSPTGMDKSEYCSNYSVKWYNGDKHKKKNNMLLLDWTLRENVQRISEKDRKRFRNIFFNWQDDMILLV